MSVKINSQINNLRLWGLVSTVNNQIVYCDSDRANVNKIRVQMMKSIGDAFRLVRFDVADCYKD